MSDDEGSSEAISQDNQTDKGIYSIVSPGTLRSKSKYNVAVTVHKAEEPCDIKVTLKGPSYEDVKTSTVQPMTTEILEFDVPSLLEGNYKLVAEGLSGIIFEKSEDLNFKESQPFVLIQTDKATYKPGDLLRFRVIFMDENTRPIEIEKPITLSVNDGGKNRLKQWKNVEITRGVFVGNYQLSDQPVLGQWLIDVSLEGRSVASKSFEVEKYVLPKFSVTVETSKNVALVEGVVNITVRSKYTYGKNVKGKVTVSINPLYLSCCVMGSTQPIKVKTMDIDGKAEVQFKIGEDIPLKHNLSPLLQITAVVEEALTGNKQEGLGTVQLHEYQFRIEGIDIPHHFYANQVTTFKLAIKDVHNNTVLDSSNPVKLRIVKNPSNYDSNSTEGPLFETVDGKKEEKNVIMIEMLENLNENGIATFEYTFAEDSGSFYTLFGEYLECKTTISSLYQCNEAPGEENQYTDLRLSIKTKEPRLGEAVEIKITTIEPISYYVYSIVARGKLLKTEFITLTEASREELITFEPTFEMIANTFVLVHYIAGHQICCDEIHIYFKNEFENFIDLIAPNEANVGEDVELEIRSEADSYVGILGVDQSVLLLRTGNDFHTYHVFDALEKYDSTAPSYRYGNYPGAKSGLAVLSNAKFSDDCDLMFFSMGLSEAMKVAPLVGPPVDAFKLPSPTNDAIQVRKEFPETWIFEDIVSLPSDGEIIRKTIPDTITSWVLTGFALHPEKGFALTKIPTQIKTFKPFFISTHLPYSLKRGEQVSIPIVVFNYMDQEVIADVTLDNLDDEYEFMEPGEDQSKRTKQIELSANSGGNVNFLICPKEIGQITLKITAVSPLAGDAVHTKLKVEPEGITIYKNRDYFLHTEDGNLDVKNTVELDIPDVVPDSEFIEVGVMGNILSSTITNIDKLVRMPYGCGEQNMINFVPNILVLWYLESLEELTTFIQEKAKRFLEIGYQRELTYKHDNGSYSAFGKSDPSGSTWLTAYVMRSFHQAKKYIDIDEKILEAGLDFLAKTQAPNGCFPEVGRVVDFSHMNAVGLTAFVLIAFLENTELMHKYQMTIDRGFEYLQQAVGKCEDLYALSISLYALQQRKLEIVHELLARLESLAHIDGGQKWWSKSNPDKCSEPNCDNDSHGIEITGYILMTLLDMNVSVLPITKWLISQRNSNGGFDSTQETVVGLWALIKFAEKSGASNPDMTIMINSTDEESESTSFDVKKDNSMVIQSVLLPKQTRGVMFDAEGTGTAILQISYRYNILEKETKPSFKLNTKVKASPDPNRLILDVQAEFVPLPNENVSSSNMAVLEVSLPSGYTALCDTFDKIKAVESVKRVETKDGKTCIVIYFDNFKLSQPKCVPIEAELSHDVTGQKPAPVVIYDYYDSQRRATEFYEIENSITEVEG